MLQIIYKDHFVLRLFYMREKLKILKWNKILYLKYTVAIALEALWLKVASINLKMLSNI